MISFMSNESHGWEKRSVELPPGWHAAVLKLSELTGVKLKYLYSVAVDRLLAESDVAGIEEAAWTLQRRSRKDLGRVASSHNAAAIERRHNRLARARNRPGRASAELTKP